MTSRSVTSQSQVTRPVRRGFFLKRISQMLAARRQRRDLSQLDAHLLKDVGLTHREAEQESKKPVWDVPSNWRV